MPRTARVSIIALARADPCGRGTGKRELRLREREKPREMDLRAAALFTSAGAALSGRSRPSDSVSRANPGFRARSRRLGLGRMRKYSERRFRQAESSFDRLFFLALSAFGWLGINLNRITTLVYVGVWRASLTPIALLFIV